jgi:hypothetical protein
VALTLGAALCNPNGVRGVTYPFLYLGDNASMRYLDEWARPDLIRPQYWPLALLTLGLVLVLLRRWRDVPLTAVAIAVPFTGLGLQSARNTSQLAVVVAPLVAAALSTDRRRNRHRAAAGHDTNAPARQASTAPAHTVAALRARHRINAALAALLIAGTIAVLAVQVRPAATAAVQRREFPVAATAHLRANPPARLLNHYDWGGYLIWAAPDVPVYVDGRPDMYGDAFVDRFMRIWTAQPEWPTLVDKDRVDAMLLPPTSRLAKAALADGWTVSYRDAVAVVLRRPAEERP